MEQTSAVSLALEDAVPSGLEAEQEYWPDDSSLFAKFLKLPHYLQTMSADFHHLVKVPHLCTSSLGGAEPFSDK